MKEIKEAARVVLEQIDLRFPQLPVLSTYSLFSADFDRAKVKKDVLDQKLRILADHLAYDFATCSKEFDDLMDEVASAKAEFGFKAEKELWGCVLPRLEANHKQMRLTEAVQLFFVLQCQNGTLERNFSHKRRMEDRLQGGWSPQGVDAHLRIQLEGLPPRDLLTYGDAGPKYNDDLVRVAHALAPKMRSSPQKNQLSLAESMQAEPPAKKIRKDKGHLHKPPSPNRMHATEVLEATASSGHAFFEEAEEKAESNRAPRKDLVLAFGDGDL